MNERTLRVLEWPKVRAIVADKTSFSLSREMVETLSPSTDMEEVRERLKLTSEAHSMLWKSGEPPFGGASDVRSVVQRAAIGGVLDPEQLQSIQDLLYCTSRLIKYMSSGEGLLKEISTGLDPLPSLARAIAQCIDDEGNVKDSASAELSRIRQKIRTVANRIRDRLESLIHSPSTQKILQEPIVTIRNGRYVVPVRSEYRGKFQGIVHDQSGSGATLFMEPAFAVELNNELRIAEQAEFEEIQRILKGLSSQVADQSSQILKNLEIIAQMDSIFARAKYSKEINGVEPHVNSEGQIHIKQGRHPLLTGHVVPIDVWLGEDFHILVITGPNTGGKTVTLKTVGLFCLMAQAGLHIPALPGSKIAVFEGIYADIGDEQSIEQSLSTFSSHMTNIVSILENVGPNSLVLLDELGAGTDPTEGAALATVILEHLRVKKVNTIATTHYSDLKNYAYTHSDVENASVEFDVKTLRPTFHLSIGIPGRSNAFAISRRLGLPEELVEAAQSLLAPDHIHVEDLIGEMEQNRRRADQARKEAERLRQDYESLRDKYGALVEELEERKAEILEEARQESERIISETRFEMDQILGEVRRLHRDELEKTVKTYRDDLEERQDKLKGERKKVSQSRGPVNLKAGEKVRIKTLRQTGYVLEPPSSNGEVIVQAGIIKVTVKVEDLERIADDTTPTIHTPRIMGRAALSKSASIRSEIDIRGKTVEEGIGIIDKYLDDAFLSSLARVRIIHGKGTGALRSAVQDYLSTHPHVKSYRDGEPNEGGTGVSVVDIHLPN